MYFHFVSYRGFSYCMSSQTHFRMKLCLDDFPAFIVLTIHFFNHKHTFVFTFLYAAGGGCYF